MAERTCSVVENGEPCPNPYYAFGWCNKHWARLRRLGSFDLPPKPTAIERFWSKVDKDGPTPAQPDLGPCWVWTAGANAHGYGQFSVSAAPMLAHRFAYTLVVGPIPSGLHVLHRCDNPPCCNPTHLFLGTHIDNMADRTRKGRQGNARKTHCVHGHEFTPENTMLRPRGGRNCRACHNKRTREASRRRRSM